MSKLETIKFKNIIFVLIILFFFITIFLESICICLSFVNNNENYEIEDLLFEPTVVIESKEILEEENKVKVILSSNSKISNIYLVENNVLTKDENFNIAEDKIEISKIFDENQTSNYIITFEDEEIESYTLSLTIDNFEQIILPIDTSSFDIDEEVIIWINEEIGILEIISTLDEEYKNYIESHENYFRGEIVSNGVSLNTVNTYLESLVNEDLSSLVSIIITEEEVIEEVTSNEIATLTSNSSSSSSKTKSSSTSNESSNNLNTNVSTSSNSSASSSNTSNSSNNSSSTSNNSTSSADSSNNSSYISTYTEYSDKAYEMLTYINTFRNNNGVLSLSWSSALAEYALIRANEIVDNFSHTRPNGSTSISSWSAVYAENIGYASYSSTSMMAETFENSENHRANLLNSSYLNVGIACVYNNSRYYWVELFGY